MAVRSFFNRMKFWKRPFNYDVAEDILNRNNILLTKRIQHCEKYIALVERIIGWDSPLYSIMCIFGLNIIFGMFMWLDCRFFGILFTSLLVFAAHEAWVDQIWPEISVPYPRRPAETDPPPSPSVVAWSKTLTSWRSSAQQHMAWLRTMRMEKHSAFCLWCALFWTCLLVLGRSVSGLQLVYILMALLLGFGVFKHCVPPCLMMPLDQQTAWMKRVMEELDSAQASFDEYLPETTLEDLALLSRVSDMAYDPYDSITNPETPSDMAPDQAIPSHEEDSMDNLSEIELVGKDVFRDHSVDSDSNPDDLPTQMQFQSGHFNGGDSSSEDSDAFARDLVFSEADEQDTGATAAATHGLSSYITQAVTSNMLASVGLLGNVIRSRQPVRREEPDSDCEDFEFINRDELNNQ